MSASIYKNTTAERFKNLLDDLGNKPEKSTQLIPANLVRAYVLSACCNTPDPVSAIMDYDPSCQNGLGDYLVGMSDYVNTLTETTVAEQLENLNGCMGLLEEEVINELSSLNFPIAYPDLPVSGKLQFELNRTISEHSLKLKYTDTTYPSSVLSVYPSPKARYEEVTCPPDWGMHMLSHALREEIISGSKEMRFISLSHMEYAVWDIMKQGSEQSIICREESDELKFIGNAILTPEYHGFPEMIGMLFVSYTDVDAIKQDINKEFFKNSFVICKGRATVASTMKVFPPAYELYSCKNGLDGCKITIMTNFTGEGYYDGRKYLPSLFSLFMAGHSYAATVLLNVILSNVDAQQHEEPGDRLFARLARPLCTGECNDSIGLIDDTEVLLMPLSQLVGMVNHGGIFGRDIYSNWGDPSSIRFSFLENMLLKGGLELTKLDRHLGG